MPLISPVVPLSVTTTGAGPVAITVPSGALGVLVAFRANHGSFTISSNFAGSWTDLTTAGTSTRLLAAPVTNTSAGRTLTLNFSGYVAEGALILVAFYDTIDNSSVAAWVRDAKAEETYELVIDSDAGDEVFGVEFWSTTSAAIPPNEAGWTSRLTPAAVNGIGGRARTLNTVGDPTSTMSAQYAAGGDYNSLALVSIIPGGGGGTDGTATGVTVSAAASLIAGTANGVRSPTAAGQVLPAAASLIAGAASAVRSPTAAGQILAASSSLIPGSASSGSNGTAVGQTLSATASLIAGTAAGVRNATAPGTTFSAGASILPGAAQGSRNGSAAGVTFPVGASLIAGSANGNSGALAPGAIFTAAAALLPGTASAVRNATAAGALFPLWASLLPGASLTLSREPSVYRSRVPAGTYASRVPLGEYTSAVAGGVYRSQVPAGSYTSTVPVD